MNEKNEIFIKNTVGYLGTTLYPNLVIILYSFQEIRDAFSAYIKARNLSAYISLINIAVIVSLFIVPGIIYYVINRVDVGKMQLKRKVMNETLSGIENIMRAKKERFNAINNERQRNVRETNVFRKVTQPRLQILEIFKNSVDVFRKVCENTSIKGSLIECQNNEIKHYFAQTDINPGINIDELKRYNTTARYVLQTKELGIVEDTRYPEKVPYYKKSKKCKSIMCFPVVDGENVIFIISFTASSYGCFKEKMREHYHFIFNEFGSRLILENYLLQLKRRTCNED